MSTATERIACWSVSNDGYRFGYQIRGKSYTFLVTDETLREILCEIEAMAIDPKSELDWDDAEYLTSMIREVVLLSQPAAEVHDEFYDVCRIAEVWEGRWAVVMAGCVAVLMVGVFFLIWGAT